MGCIGYNVWMSESPSPRRSVRSFVRRSGRLTPSQRRAIEDLWPRFGISFSEAPLNLPAIFGRDAPLVLEIGFGNGDCLVQMASEHRCWDFLGVDVHEPGIGHCLIGAREHDLENLRLISHDAMEVLQHQLADGSLSRINLYFPDPWPKKRHHKRRIVNAPFLQLLAAKLGASGTVHIATDWQNYAEHIDEVVAATNAFRVAERREHAGDRPLDRPSTKSERRGIREGHRIWDWRLTRI